MESNRNNKPAKLAPDLDSKVRFLQKNRKKEFEGAGGMEILLVDALQASRASQLYHEGSLSSQYQERIRILSTSAVHEADQELSRMLQEIPELSDYEFSKGDPGLYLLKQCVQPARPNPVDADQVLIIDSVQPLYELFKVMIEYAFYKKKKKVLADEFLAAADRMDELRIRLKLPGRFSRNAHVNQGKVKREKLSLDYLQKYRATSTQLSEQND